MVFKLPMRLIHPIHHPLAVWQVGLFTDFQKCNKGDFPKRVSAYANKGVIVKSFLKMFLVSRFLVLVNQDLELVEIQFQPILYLILLVPFLQVQLINHLRQHHPKRKNSSWNFPDLNLAKVFWRSGLPWPIFNVRGDNENHFWKPKWLSLRNRFQKWPLSRPRTLKIDDEISRHQGSTVQNRLGGPDRTKKKWEI